MQFSLVFKLNPQNTIRGAEHLSSQVSFGIAHTPENLTYQLPFALNYLHFLKLHSVVVNRSGNLLKTCWKRVKNASKKQKKDDRSAKFSIRKRINNLFSAENKVGLVLVAIVVADVNEWIAIVMWMNWNMHASAIIVCSFHGTRAAWRGNAASEALEFPLLPKCYCSNLSRYAFSCT